MNPQILQLLMQFLHVIGDYCNDWDCIADCLSQSRALVAATDEYGKEDTVSMTSLLESIVNISMFLREENLVKFMTSFVTLSTSDIESLLIRQDAYEGFISADFQTILKDSLSSEGFVSFATWSGPNCFSFSVVVTTAKLNARRISGVWQMVASHIRLVASSKVCFSILLLQNNYKIHSLT